MRADFFQYYGLDLSHLLRQRRYDTCLQLIDELPDRARINTARLEDDELWADIELPQAKENPSPPLSEWGMSEELLAAISDRIDSLIATIHSIAGGKSTRRPKPVPRPETALGRVRQKRSRQGQQEIINIFTPGR